MIRTSFVALAALVAQASGALALDTLTRTTNVVFHVADANLDIPAMVSIPSPDAPNLRDGRRPVMFVMHTCGGMSGKETRVSAYAPLAEEASWFRMRGFVTIMPDSFSPREALDVCNEQNVMPADRAEDLFAIARQLDAIEGVKLDLSRLYAVGYSHGGQAVVEAAAMQVPETFEGPRLQGVIAYYPDCASLTNVGALDVAPADLLILLGERDKWADTEVCVRAVEKRGDARHVRAFVFPDVTHGFNLRMMDPRAYGHTVDTRKGGSLTNSPGQFAYNQNAAEAARGVMRDYLREKGFSVD